MSKSNRERTTDASGLESLRLKIATRSAGLLPKLDPSGHVIIFTHLGKTGGTTLDHIFHAAATAVGRRWKRLLKGSSADDSVNEHNQRLLDFNNLPPGALRAADYLTGHFQFGLHRRLDRPSLYVALMRDPATRLLSNIRFRIDNGTWPENHSIDAVFAGKIFLDNIQTRQLAGLVDWRAPCTAETLATARENIRQHYAVVGVTERFDDTLRTLITLLGWPDIAYTDRQVSRSRIDPELEAKATAAVQCHFAYDLELYAEAAARPTPWSPEVMTGSVTGPARQDTVLVTSPVIRRGNQPFALVSAAEFDTQLCPVIKNAGGEVVFV